MTTQVGVDTALADVLEAVMEDLLELVDGLERHGGYYARLYALATLGPGRRTPPRPPGLAPDAASLVRQITLDHLAARRAGL